MYLVPLFPINTKNSRISSCILLGWSEDTTGRKLKKKKIKTIHLTWKKIFKNTKKYLKNN